MNTHTVNKSLFGTDNTENQFYIYLSIILPITMSNILSCNCISRDSIYTSFFCPNLVSDFSISRLIVLFDSKTVLNDNNFDIVIDSLCIGY